MTKLRQTPSQTVGPYFAYGLSPEQYGYQHGLTSIAGSEMAPDDVEGQRIRVEGRVFDGNGNPISDALIEIWQADSMGRYAHPSDPRGSNSNFKGFGRCGTGTDPRHRYWFDTIKPGKVDDDQAPHLNVIVTMRGMLLHAFTRIYFSDEPVANAMDKVLNAVPAERRNTLIATHENGNVYRFDIHMQGDDETVFFDA
jgi:protocatechuate 3,4-dioxygenase, alpha subunit